MATGSTRQARDVRHSQSPPFDTGEYPSIEAPPGGWAEPRTSVGRVVTQLFAHADVRINGERPQDIRVRDSRFYQRLLSESSLGAGESYVDGWWDVPAIDELFYRIQCANLETKFRSWNVAWFALKGRLFNLQTKSLSGEVARRHYDLGNDLYQAMLDRRMQYTCAYWKNAETLDEAQEHKLDLIARKMYVTRGMAVLELGGGFGGLAHFLATKYGCRVVSYNISAEQVHYARELCRGLPVRFEQKDYREASHELGQFDRVVSIGLCEHIGYKNYRPFLELAFSKLKDQGLFLLHTIGDIQSLTTTDPWINKYVFPNGVIPSITQLGKAMEKLWVMEDWHNFGPDYDRTLMCWWKNFDRAWPTLQHKYSDRFYRLWKYYLLSCAGSFRARKLQLWQILLSKGDIGSYTPVR